MKISWWQWWPLWSWRAVGMVESADEIPARLPSRGAVLVGTPGRLKWISFDCPCRMKHRVLLNTDRARRPFWAVEISAEGRLSISPSIDQLNGRRRCHYFVRNGKTIWAKDVRL
jgi:hypothetical protein